MSKADDVFIRQFIIVLILLAAYGVGAGVLGVWIADSARDASAGSERATLERIAPVGRLKLGEPGQRNRAEAAGSGSGSGSGATAAATATDQSASGSADASGTTAAAAASPGGATGAVAVNDAGEKIYKQYCFACHLTGVAEAPRTGDREAWAPRAATGFEALYQSVINGKGAMPPRAGFPHLSDDELKVGIEYLLTAANVTAK